MESTVLEQEKTETVLRFPKKSSAALLSQTVQQPIKQYLYFAFRRSLRDKETYEDAASHIPDDDRRIFLLEMALRKKEEAELLYSFYKADGYRAMLKMKKRSIISIPHYQPGINMSQIASIEDTYSFAFAREHNKQVLYLNLAGLDSNRQTKNLFNYLSQLQTNHISFIEEKLARLTRQYAV
ncbi:MAG TPA: hypothetical protein VLX68_14680 [Chitinivibrionales bacterium]|nr:hypothetical protein [Chitinivibrionales bacterium]